MEVNRMSRKKHPFLSIPLKFQIFIPPKIGRNEGNEIRFNNFFTKTPKTPIYLTIYFKIWV